MLSFSINRTKGTGVKRTVDTLCLNEKKKKESIPVVGVRNGNTYPCFRRCRGGICLVLRSGL